MRRAEGNGQRAAVNPMLGLVASTWDGRQVGDGFLAGCGQRPGSDFLVGVPCAIKIVPVGSSRVLRLSGCRDDEHGPLFTLGSSITVGS